ncbi:MAG: hypothetical protein KAJ19_18040 [Gammaproteobacteria bacterium]|nr:hypothetical protein [Gammaproteobacteria bacterium]
MAIQFVNVTVDTSALYQVQARDFGTVAVVGVGAVSGSSITPIRLGNYAEVDALYPTDSELSIGVKNAFANGASSVYAVDLGQTKNLSSVETALAGLVNIDVQMVALANTPETDAIAYISDALASHVEAAGTERVGVFALAQDEDASTAPTAITNMLAANKTRMFGVAHKSASDVATSVAGLLASIKQWESPILKATSNIVQTTQFTTAQISALNTAQLNPMIDPLYLTGTGYILGTDYTLGTISDGIYRVDVRRTLDDITYKLKAGLTNPTVIGNIRINKTGLSVLNGKMGAILQAAVNDGEIDSYTIDIPVMLALIKDINSRSDAEALLITTARTTRNVDTIVSVVYSGALHTIDVELKFTV